MDNRSGWCGPCARRHAQARSAEPQPAEFWERPGLREAFAARHFGRVLYAYRYEHRPVLTQARIGRLLGLSQAQVSRLEREDQPASDLNKLV